MGEPQEPRTVAGGFGPCCYESKLWKVIQVSYANRINAAFDRAFDMKQRGLAEATGISQPIINRILRVTGDREPKLSELIALAVALGCTLGTAG